MSQYAEQQVHLLWQELDRMRKESGHIFRQMLEAIEKLEREIIDLKGAQM